MGGRETKAPLHPEPPCHVWSSPCCTLAAHCSDRAPFLPPSWFVFLLTNSRSSSSHRRCLVCRPPEELAANRCFNPTQICITKEANANLIPHVSLQAAAHRWLDVASSVLTEQTGNVPCKQMFTFSFLSSKPAVAKLTLLLQ